MKNRLNFLIITGLTDAEGSFIVNIIKDEKEYKTSPPLPLSRFKRFL